MTTLMPTLDRRVESGISASALRVFTRFTEISNSLGTVWILALMVLVCADILGRFVFNSPIRGVAEIVAFSIVAIVFLQLPNTLSVGRITRAEVIIDALHLRHKQAAHVYEIVFLTLGAIIFVLITWGSLPIAIDAWVENDYYGVHGNFTVPSWPIKWIVVVGAAVTAMQYFVGVGRSVTQFLQSGDHARANGAGHRFALIGLGLVAAVCLTLPFLDLSRTQIGVISVGLMLVFVYLGMHIGVALIVLALAGIAMLKGNAALALKTLALSAGGAVSDYVFGVVPLFVLLGLVVGISGFGRDTFDVAQALVGRVRGGLGIATVAANAIFAAITGVSIASAAIFTKIAVPEMVKHGYTPKFAVGVVAGSSVLGMLIPPSILLIVYGFLAEVSVGQLFVAAAVPGVLLAVAFAVGIHFMARLFPDFVGHVNARESSPLPLGQAIGKISPVIAMVGIVLGGIYGGVFTPTEAGAAGAAVALALAVFRRRISRKDLWKVLIETGHVTVSILFLIIAASVYSKMLALTGIPMAVAQFMSEMGLGFLGFMMVYLGVVIILGTILDSTSIMLIVLPLVLPVVTQMGGDLIWFGIVTVISVELGLLTPPLGIAVYVVKASLEDKSITLGQIFSGAFPFVVIMALVTVFLILFPQISLVFV